MSAFPPPRKKLGQHFLAEPDIVARIIAALDGGGNIIEIGPGRGALTAGLLNIGGQLTAVELDAELASRLQEKYPRLQVIQQDILKFNLRAAGAPPFRLVGNLPYQITTALIFHLLTQINDIVDMHFMVQREVALRLCAKVGDKNYGRLTVMTALKLDVEFLFEVKPEAFNPPPKVFSAVVRLLPKNNHKLANCKQTLQKIVSLAFQQRRKFLSNALSTIATPQDFINADINPDLRPQQLSPQQYIALSDVITARGE